MREAGLRTVLLAQACEEADPEGAFVPHAAREAASREAASWSEGPIEAEAAQGEGVLEARAARLLERIGAEHPSVAGLAARAQFTPPAGLVLVGAFLLGLVADGLGGQRELNLLAFPLLGLVAWNLAVYGAGLARFATRGRRTGARPAEAARAWDFVRTRLPGRSDGAWAFRRRVAGRFSALWLERAGVLEAARWRARLHAGAAFFALGVVLGLYLAGFAFAYRATWESTFLAADQVRTLLVILLGPASSLLGEPLPDVRAIAALQAPGSGPAASWIHRWAVTVGLLVIVPRLVLAFRSAAQARIAAGSLSPDLATPYAMRLLAAGRGEGKVHAIVPYSMEPSAASAARLRELAHELFGNRARVSLLGHVSYGGDPPAETATDTESTLR